MTKEKTEKQKQEEMGLITVTIILPLVVGFALVYSGITMTLFKIIGWILLIFGAFFGSLYLLRLYAENKEKVKKTKEEVFDVFRKVKGGEEKK